MSPDEQKQAAADAALAYIENGMRLGLGSGSTAACFVDGLGKAVSDGLDVLCVPTSNATEAQAKALGIPLSTLDDTPELDLTVDGADELDDHLSLIKGGGGALLREKVVATSSARMIVIADASKHVATLGKFPLPIEVIPFGHQATRGKIVAASGEHGSHGDVNLRMAGDSPFVTDNGNLIYDCHFGVIPDAPALANTLSVIAGVAEHGLFIGIANLAVIGAPDGVHTIEAKA